MTPPTDSARIATPKKAPAKKAAKATAKKATPAKAPAKKAAAKPKVEAKPDQLLDIIVGRIQPAKDNLRSQLDQEAVDNLAASIKDVGLIEPLIVVERGPNSYEIVAGHHRFAALKQIKAATAKCIVRDHGDGDDRWIVMLIENLHRSDLHPADEADGYQRLAKAGWTQARIAQTVNCSQSHVSKRLAIAGLPDVARTAMVNGKLDVTSAEVLARIKDKAKVKKLLGDGTQLVNSWDVQGALRTQENAERKAANLEEAKASGLTVVTNADYWRTYERAARSIATHVHVAANGEVVWLIKRQNAQTPAPTKADKEREARRVTWAGLVQHLTEHLAGAIQSGTFDTKRANALLVDGWIIAARNGLPVYETEPAEGACKLLGLEVAKTTDGVHWDEIDGYPGSAEINAYSAQSAANRHRASVAVLATLVLSQCSTLAPPPTDGDLSNNGEVLGLNAVLEYAAATGFKLTDAEQEEFDRRYKPINLNPDIESVS